MITIANTVVPSMCQAVKVCTSVELLYCGKIYVTTCTILNFSKCTVRIAQPLPASISRRFCHSKLKSCATPLSLSPSLGNLYSTCSLYIRRRYRYRLCIEYYEYHEYRGYYVAHISGITQYLCLDYLTLHNFFKVHPCSSRCQNFIPFYGWIVFLCVGILPFVDSFTYGCTFGLFLPFGNCE